MDYFVSVSGDDFGPGSKERPFKTISKAASLAVAGDSVTVGAGTYREWVKPANGGSGEDKRIVYRAAKGEKVIIKGSEELKGWKNEGGSVWSASVPNSIFEGAASYGECNPFAKPLWGDWVVWPLEKENEKQVHLGDVYLNGKSFYEAHSLEEVRKAEKRLTGYNPPWTKHEEAILEVEQTVYQWFAEVSREETKIYANFHGFDPNKELVEISVRQSCFYPDRTGLDYITVQGFEMCQAASPWAPPTADQPGMIGPHWAKGWIIEDCIFHDAKCSAVSLGKEISTGDNDCTKFREKPGYQYQMEAVFRAKKDGWSKEKIGSHIIRNNTIYDCGQNGIVGHMGCIFSKIEHNHIYNIAVKHEYFGYEIAGIKLHAGIDVQVIENNIHNCTLGSWFDWQTQGVRISGNLYYANDRDLMVEVSHGPYIVDNNIFASPYNFDNISQGGAYIHNFCAGTMRREQVVDRSTPYHLPHSTDLLGTALVFSGDDRLYQNIFVGGQETFTPQSKSGTDGYDECIMHPMCKEMNKWFKTEQLNTGCARSWQEYKERIKEAGDGDHDVFMRVMQAAYVNGNHYCFDAKAFSGEKDNTFSKENPMLEIREEKGKFYAEFTADQSLFKTKTEPIETKMLGRPRICNFRFEAPDGSEIVFNRDICGNERSKSPIPGPFEKIEAGKNKVLVWEK